MNVFGERYVPVGSVEAPDGELIDAIDSFHARPVALLVRAAGPRSVMKKAVFQVCRGGRQALPVVSLPGRLRRPGSAWPAEAA